MITMGYIVNTGLLCTGFGHCCEEKSYPDSNIWFFVKNMLGKKSKINSLDWFVMRLGTCIIFGF